MRSSKAQEILSSMERRFIHSAVKACVGSGMDWATALNVPEADDINFYDTDDLELQVKTSKAKVNIGEPVEVSWTLKNKVGAEIHIRGSIAPSEHGTRVSVTKPEAQ